MNRIIIVGGGVIGMLTALELAQARQSVVLFERAETGREASWAGGGILSPLFPWRYLDSVTRLASWSQAAYPDFCSRLAQDTGIDPEYTKNGMILVAPDESDQAEHWAQRHQRNLVSIDAPQFRQLEPRAADPADAAFWMPHVAQVRNPRLIRALRRQLESLGVQLRTGQLVQRLLYDSGRCRGVHADGEHRADAVIVCSGAWSGELLRNYPSPPSIHPVRGQMLLFRAAPGTISRIVLEANRYVIPRRDGRTLFGSTLEEVGFDKQTTTAAHDELRAIATQRFPVLRDFPIEAHWAGLRPSSPAGVPYIGPHPQIGGLFINSGHYRNGIVLGLASARLAADLVLGHPPILDPSPYGWTKPRG